MERIKHCWHYVFGEPLVWLFYWCFQPGRFAREYEKRNVLRRIGPSLRLIFPQFLITCLVTIGARMGLRLILAIPSPHLVDVLFSIIVAVLVGVILGVAASIGLGLNSGISIGFASSVSFGLVVGHITGSSLEAHILGGIAGALVITCMLSIAGGRAGNDVLLGISAGVVAGVTVGVVTKLTVGDDVADMILGCMVGMTAGITASRRKVRPPGGAHPRSRSLVIGAVLTGVVVVLNTWTGGLVFASTFLLILYRLPLYPVNSFSSWTALLASRKQPSHVFMYLHNSSLYWDEYVYCPLPGLKPMLRIAAEQNVARTLEEVTFIMMERPLQIAAARAVSLEIALLDLRMRDTLRDIAEASLRLSKIFPHGTGLVAPQWSMTLVRLRDASENAAQACSPLGWQAKHNALAALLADLKRIHPHTAFADAEMNTRLADVLVTWQGVALRAISALEKAPEKTRRISNPYNPGPALERYNKLFIGRYDLISLLGEALAQRDHRPTILLYGERRMGKSSILKHLPDLLGARFLPVFYDLQSPDSISSLAAFLAIVAEQIVLSMEMRGLKAKKLEYERLNEVRKENEAAVYYVFNRWLRGVEKTLEREDRILLLMFDEFENLNRAGKELYLDLKMLLNWFRSLIQHHPRLALLFSGVQHFDELDRGWAGFFVNVQTLKAGFLQPSEARQLIAQPLLPMFAEQVFGQGVIEEILRVTGCHPFLIQALCSALIDAFNSHRRKQIEIQDVTKAIAMVFKNWGSTYFRDLWNRTDTAQRVCLFILNKQESNDLHSIEQQSGLDRQTVNRAVEILVERDLVHMDERGFYQLATPLFREWVERNEFVNSAVNRKVGTLFDDRGR